MSKLVGQPISKLLPMKVVSCEFIAGVSHMAGYLSQIFGYKYISWVRALKTARLPSSSHPINYFPQGLGKTIKNCPPKVNHSHLSPSFDVLK